MLHFDMQNQVAVIDATTAMGVPEILRIYKKFNKNPDLRDRVLTYIHIVSKLDPKAPFFGAESTEIADLAKSTYFTETTPFPTDAENQINVAMAQYIKAFEKAEVRILKLFDDKIDQIKNLIAKTVPKIEENTNPVSGAVTFTTNIDIITKSLEKIDGLLVAKGKLEAKIRNESEGKGSVRGGKKPSLLERRSMVK